MYRTHTCNELNLESDGQEIELSGWVHRRRDHGGVIFIDLRDRYGLTQIVSDPVDHKEAHDSMDKVRGEFVIHIKGRVRPRPEGQTNKNLETGEIEVLVTELEILNTSKTPPFEIDQDKDVSEDLRLKYRYLDLRRDRMKSNILLRHQVIKSIREFLDEEDFVEVETPILIKGTPEGSREYLVPSRIYPGNFYVLPQSPQQLKQLLMVSGFDRYYQIARCFRDEDQRGDRQPEFTQIDVEMSFVTQDDILELFEKLFFEVSTKIYPDKKILSKPFQRITFDDAMNKYGIDKPELRTDQLQLVDISDIAAQSDFKVFKSIVEWWWVVKWMVVNKIFSRWEIDKFTALLQEKWAKWMAYIIWDAEWPRSPILKFFSDEQKNEIYKKIGAKEWTTSFFQATDWLSATSFLWYLRTILIKKLELTKWKENELAYAWIVDFPMFEVDDTWGISAMHHPFTKPKDEFIPYVIEIWKKLQEWWTLSDEDRAKLLEIRADAYDVALNWVEVWWWSIRIADPVLQKAIFSILWLSDTQITERFNHILEAFKYWVPPHGWLAIWYDRFVMVTQNMPNIREVIAFPKTQKWDDLMLQSPSEIEPKLLGELKLKVVE